MYTIGTVKREREELKMIERIYYVEKNSITDERLAIVYNQFPIFSNIDWDTYDNIPEGMSITLHITCRKEDLKSIDKLMGA